MKCGPTPRGNADVQQRKEVAGKAIRKTMKQRADKSNFAVLLRREASSQESERSFRASLTNSYSI